MIERVSVIDATVAEIKQMIESGMFAVGDKLPTEMSICDSLGVGRSTVREAFRILQAKGYVEMRPGKGAFVASARPERENVVNWFSTHHLELLDFMDIRLAIEPLAVKLAVERATDEEIEAMDVLFKAFEAAVERGDCTVLPELDESFHNAIIHSTHNSLMISINKSICEAFKEYRAKAFLNIGDAYHALEPHRNILNALKNRNADEGKKAMRKHIAISLKDIENNK